MKPSINFHNFFHTFSTIFYLTLNLSPLLNVKADGVLSCYRGVAFDLVQSVPSLRREESCIYCTRTKVELTIGKAKSIAEGGQLPGVGVTFWDCAKSAEFGVGLPIIDDALDEVRSYLDQLQNKVLCTNAMIEMRPEKTGRITVCSCCSDLCNNDNELCTTSTYTSLSNLFIDPFITAAQAYLTNASLMTGIQLGFDIPMVISQANDNCQSHNYFLLFVSISLTSLVLFFRQQ